MADMEMINLNTGKRLRIKRDGTELRDEVIPPAIEWCDKGQHYAPKLGGQDQYNMLWVCLQCQSAE